MSRTTPAFFSRATLGQPNSVLVAMGIAFVLALAPHGIRQSLENSSTQMEAWLPQASAEGSDLAWFRSYFSDESFALMSWEGCTLGATESIETLAQKLLPTEADVRNAVSDPALEADYRLRREWFTRVVTGPRAISELKETHSEAEAAARFEGALVGPPQTDAFGNSLGNATRPTCVVVYFSSEVVANGATARRAIAKLTQIAVEEGGIAGESLHLGGPAVTIAALDRAWMHGLPSIAIGIVLASALIGRWRLKSWKATGMAVGLGLVCAGVSLALVFYSGVFQVTLLAIDRREISRVDALSAFLPMIAFALGAFGAIHAINYYCQVRREEGEGGIVEASVRRGWRATLLWGIATSVVFLSLGATDIVPLRNLGFFVVLSTLATLGALATLVPLLLHRLGVDAEPFAKRLVGPSGPSIVPWGERLFRFGLRRRGFALCIYFGGLCLLGWGALRLGRDMPASQWLGVDARVERDHRWLEANLGNVIPLEVVIAWPQSRCRAADQVADADGLRYRLTMLERLEMIREIQRRQATIPEVSQVLSIASFAPKSSQVGVGAFDASADYAKNLHLEQQRDRWMAGDYYRLETSSIDGHEGSKHGRELWRMSARVALYSKEGKGVDYATLMPSLTDSVDSVLRAYDQRDQIVRALHAQGKKLHGARCVFLYRSNVREGSLTPDSAELTLLDLVRRSGAAQQDKGLIPFNLANYDKPQQGSTGADVQYRQAAVKALQQYDAIVVSSLVDDPTVKQLTADGLPIVDVAVGEFTGQGEPIGPVDTRAASPSQPLRVAYLGAPAWCSWLQQQTPRSLVRCLAWATLGVAGVMMAALQSALGGIVVTSAILMPIVAFLGTLGWCGVDANVGFLLASCLALGISCGNAVHFLGWYRRALGAGLATQVAAIHAYERCGNAMAHSNWVVGATLATVAFGPLPYWQTTGAMVGGLISAALLTHWILLPSLLASRLGSSFAAAVPTDLAGRLPQSGDVVDAYEKLRPQIGMPPSEGVAPQCSVAAELVQSNAAPLDGRRARTESTLVSAEERQAIADGPHAELHAKLRRLRRESARDA